MPVMPITPVAPVRSALAELLALQSGVVTHTQLVEHGVDAATIRRRLRCGGLVAHPHGVYAARPGRLTWLERAWAAVLVLAPAALTHGSALRADDGPGRVPVQDLLHVAIDRTRAPTPPTGVRLHAMAHLRDQVRWDAAPPRVRVEHAVLDVAAVAPDDQAAAVVLADAVRSRRTTVDDLRSTLDARHDLARHRPLLLGLLAQPATPTRAPCASRLTGCVLLSSSAS